MRNVKQLL